MTVIQLEKRVAKLENQIKAITKRQEYAGAIQGVREGLRQMEQGMGVPLDQAIRKIRASMKVRRKRRL
ncbi:MAG: hypothetical protein H7144_05130 [Burkholderiales bacterium]|nr:hypothetical protein [Phycisphaerae bacterium]